jgi:hypothetical protein
LIRQIWVSPEFKQQFYRLTVPIGSGCQEWPNAPLVNFVNIFTLHHKLLNFLYRTYLYSVMQWASAEFGTNNEKACGNKACFFKAGLNQRTATFESNDLRTL